MWWSGGNFGLWFDGILRWLMKWWCKLVIIFLVSFLSFVIEFIIIVLLLDGEDYIGMGVF